MLDDTDSQELLLAPCNLLAQGNVPAVIGTALMGARFDRIDETQRWREGDCHRLYGCVASSQEHWPKQIMKVLEMGVCSILARLVPPERAQIVLDICCEQPLMRTQNATISDR